MNGFLKRLYHEKKLKQAVIVNGPTSLRVNRICRCFDVTLFRAEVGESNVLSLAKQKMEQGYAVRFIGEGSNGGNITFPSTIRDPLATMMSLIKLLFLKKADFYDTFKRSKDENDENDENETLYDAIVKRLDLGIKGTCSNASREAFLFTKGIRIGMKRALCLKRKH